MHVYYYSVEPFFLLKKSLEDQQTIEEIDVSIIDTILLCTGSNRSYNTNHPNNNTRKS